MKKAQFIKIISTLPNDVNWRFHWVVGNDEMRGINWIRRTADYELIMFNIRSGQNVILNKGRTSKDIYELRERLEQKYSRWIAQYYKQHKP